MKTRTKRLAALATVPLILPVLVAATSSVLPAQAASKSKAKPSSTPTAKPTTTPKGDGEGPDDTPAPPARISAQTARATALRAHPGTATKVELENQNGRAVYAVHITESNKSKIEVEVDGNTGRVLGTEADDGEVNDGETNDGPTPRPRITVQAARVIALHAHPGTVTKVELENDNGRAVYSVSITASNNQKLDVKVDGNTGRVLGTEPADGGTNDGGTNDGSANNGETAN